MAITSAQVIARAVKEVPRIIRDGVANEVGGRPDFIANGDPESIPGQLAQAAARGACRRYASNPAAFPGEKAVNAEIACRPYLDQVNPGGGPAIGLPFRGGQCPEPYRLFGNVNFLIRTQDGNFGQSTLDVTTEYSLLGPIGGISFRYDTPNAGGFRRWIMDVQTGAGLVQGVASFLNPIATNSVLNAAFVGTIEIQPGKADVCGNPPPVVKQPRPDADPTPPPFRFNPGPDIDVDINIDVGPDGDITFDFGTGPITIDPFGDDDGDDGGPGGGGGGPGGGPPPGDIGTPGGTGGTGPGGDVDGEAPEGSVLTALKIDFASPPVNGNEYAPGIYRGVCYIYMGTSDGVDHDPAGAMLRDGQIIFAEKDNLTHWFVSANLGYDLDVTPYYRAVEA